MSYMAKLFLLSVKTFLSVVITTLILVSCGGGTSDDDADSAVNELEVIDDSNPESGTTQNGANPGNDQVVANSSNDVGATNLSCQVFLNESDLNQGTAPNVFAGLWSNWQNGPDLAGHDEALDFIDAFGNLTAVAHENNDDRLKGVLVQSLDRWIADDAFTGTKICGRDGEPCTAWLDPAGFDVSDTQTYNFVLLHVEQARAIYTYLSDWAAINEPEAHNRTVNWLAFWESTMPQPSEVYFGLGTGFYQWKIQQLVNSGDFESAQGFARRLVNGMDALINDDGSIIGRTFRGNRALWYHFTGLNEILATVRLDSLMGTNAIDFYEKIHNAVDLFLQTLDDPSYILPWASASLNDGGDGTLQYFFPDRPNNFENWDDTSSNVTWVYIYMNEFPDHSNTEKLKELIPRNSRSASMDNQYFPVGCMLF